MSTSRRTFLASLAAGAGVAAAQQRKPNIVYLMLDDLGYADMGCYGQKKIKTPNIDRLAREGMRFTDVYAGASVCAPSRCTLMTGYHTGHCTVRANALTAPLRDEDITVGEVLKQAGYNTGVFGKWGLGDAGSTGVPNKQGFDEFFGYLHQIHAHTYYPDFLWKNDTKSPLPGNRDGKRGQWSADLMAGSMYQFLRQQKDRPFFLYGAFTLPHGRFEVPDNEPYTKEDWPEPEKKYAAMVTRADAQIGVIMRMLKEQGLDGNTIVFCCSDNGSALGEGRNREFFQSCGPLRGQKGQLWEGGIRVPMIVRWPGKIRPGTENGLPWAFWDFMPTAAELAGVKPPAGIDGISVLPTLLGKGTQQKREFMYWEDHAFDQKNMKLREEVMVQAVRMGDWKAIRPKPGAPLELYNLKDDIGESKNLAAQQPKLVAKIEQYLKTARSAPRPHVGGRAQYAR